MTERWIDLDDQLLVVAQHELGTTEVSETVRMALRQAVCRAASARQIDWLRQGGLEEMSDRASRAEVWR